MNFKLIGAIGLMFALTQQLFAQSDTTFTYQGRLTQTGGAANGSFDMEAERWVQIFTSPLGDQTTTMRLSARYLSLSIAHSQV